MVETNQKIFAMVVLAFVLSVPAMPGGHSLVSDKIAERTTDLQPFELNWRSMALAQNEQKSTESQNPSTNENPDQPAAAEAAVKENNGNKSSNAAQKPFKPSEEVAAEQVVDYPVDI